MCEDQDRGLNVGTIGRGIRRSEIRKSNMKEGKIGRKGGEKGERFEGLKEKRQGEVSRWAFPSHSASSVQPANQCGRHVDPQNGRPLTLPYAFFVLLLRRLVLTQSCFVSLSSSMHAIGILCELYHRGLSISSPLLHVSITM